jgi:hypothetical protein
MMGDGDADMRMMKRLMMNIVKGEEVNCKRERMDVMIRE